MQNFNRYISNQTVHRALASRNIVDSGHGATKAPSDQNTDIHSNDSHYRQYSQSRATAGFRRNPLKPADKGDNGSDGDARLERDAANPGWHTPVVSKYRYLGNEATDGNRFETAYINESIKAPRWVDLRRRSGRTITVLKTPGDQDTARQQTPDFLLRKILEAKDDCYEWKKQASMARGIRLPILLLQMMIRADESQLLVKTELSELLPNKKEWDRTMSIVSKKGYTEDDLNHYVYVLQGKSDDVRCHRFLERATPKPLFILSFLLRRNSGLSNIATLDALISHCGNVCDNPGYHSVHKTNPQRKPDLASKLAFTPATFNSVIGLLAYHCHRLEPRLVVRLAEITGQYIQNLAAVSKIRAKTYQTQCIVFNNALRTLQPQSQLQPIQRASPNAYFWEAQRILLAMSAGLEQPLLVDQYGFRAIREVLAGLPKNQTEIHSSARHSPTWPPYLQPGDGMDEVTEPEDNWSRAVRAGVLMQEAGFAKEARDDALDILQGMAPDGTPTIQQRSLISQKRKLSVWVSSIKATRDAQEAWERFRNPPTAGLRPGPSEYAAMFEKLVLREADANTRVSPGDKALNFPTQREANLAEFEKARLRPPSVAQLYQQMRLDGVHVQHNCLQILIANAESVETAHRYLRENVEDSSIVGSLTSDEADPCSLQRVNIGLFAAYIQLLTRREGKRSLKYLMRAIHMAGLRSEPESSPWVGFIWGLILKNLSQHHHALKVSLAGQMDLFLTVVERIGTSNGASAATLVQLSKCIRKMARRELDKFNIEPAEEDFFAEESDSLRRLYDWLMTQKDDDLKLPSEKGKSQKHSTDNGNMPPLSVLSRGASHLKTLFNKMTCKEEETRQLLCMHNLEGLDQMMWRKDPVRSEHAHEYMLSLAFVGEFGEMARVLTWLIGEWGQPDLVEAVSDLDEPPPYTDFLETLCAFRLLAEPMLDQEVIDSLVETMAESRLGWTWPDDEAVAAYAAMQPDESIAKLGQIVEWAKNRRLQQDEVEL